MHPFLEALHAFRRLFHVVAHAAGIPAIALRARVGDARLDHVTGPAAERADLRLLEELGLEGRNLLVHGREGIRVLPNRGFTLSGDERCHAELAPFVGGELEGHDAAHRLARSAVAESATRHVRQLRFFGGRLRCRERHLLLRDPLQCQLVGCSLRVRSRFGFSGRLGFGDYFRVSCRLCLGSCFGLGCGPCLRCRFFGGDFLGGRGTLGGGLRTLLVGLLSCLLRCALLGGGFRFR